MSGKKNLAGMYGDKSKITRGDIITAAKKNKKKTLMGQMARKEHQSPSGGLNAAGRKHFGVKAPVNKGTNPRRVSFAARFAGMKGPMKDEKGRPTRKALALKKWGFGSVASARSFANNNKQSA